MKKILPLLLLLILAACSTNKALPSWVLEVPHDPMYYSAIVSQSKHQANYKDLARDQALRDIAMQISTQIDASINVSEREAWGIANTEYLSTLQASSSAAIRELQLSDSFENADYYYAYYRLNKAQYHQQRIILRDRALASAADLLDRYDAISGDPAVGIPLLLQALELLADFLDMELVLAYEDNPINIYNEVSSRLRAIPASLQLSFTPSRMEAMSRMAGSQYAKAKILMQESPAPGMPVLFTYESGEGSISESAISDARGEIQLQIKRIDSSQSPQRISMKLDKDSFSANLSKPAVKRIWESISFSPAYLVLDVRKPRIYLDYSFVAAYQNGLRESIVAQLATHQLDLAAKLEDAQYLLKIRIFAKKGEYLPNLDYYTSFGDIHLTLEDPKSGAMLNYLERLNLKSGAKSREAAERAVEKDAVAAIADGMLYRLLYGIVLN